MTLYDVTRVRLFLLGCGVVALTACGGTAATNTPNISSPTTGVTVTRAAGASTNPTTATPSVTAVTASASAASGQTTGAAPVGTVIAATPAVGVSSTGVGRLEVTLMGTFEAACDYQIAGTGLMPGSQIDYVGQLGKRQYGPVAADGTYRMRQLSLAKDADYGTLTATARDGSKVTTQYQVACSPLGPGYG